MITCRNIGFAGRVGNTLFQYAALFGIAKKLNLDFGIPYENANVSTKFGYYDFFANEWIHYRFDLAEVFEITAKNISFNDYNPKYLYYEKHFKFDKEVFNLKDNTDINGWFQSYKYFEHCEEDLRKEFRFNRQFNEKATHHFKNLGLFDDKYFNKKNLLISMRLDDGYMFDKNFATTNIQYYKKALKEFNLDAYNIIVTADKPIECANIIKKLVGKRKIFILNEPCPYTTLAFYNLCTDFIIPNSTFSWWGSYIGTNSEEAKVVIPKQWFNSEADTTSMSPGNWIRI